ncbi:MAG: ATP-binding protein [Actinomycetes bacterium]
MRRRLIVSTLAVVVVAVALVGVPLGVIGAYLIDDQAKAGLGRDAQRVLAAVESEERETDVTRDLVDRVLSPEREALVSMPDGRTVTAGRSIAGQRLVATASGQTGTMVQVAVSPEETRARKAQLWGIVGGAAALAVVVAIGLAVWQGRRLTAPLLDLAYAAERIGWDRPARNRRYDVPELDRVAVQLTRSADRVQRMLAAERRLAMDISHQLRTPLTALSMRLEEILAAGDGEVVEEEATAALAQVERLTGVIDQLLAQTREAHTPAVPTPLDGVIDQQLQEWRPVFEKAGRHLVVEGRRGLVALGSPGGLAQVLATLLENSLVHGAGVVTLRTRETTGSVVLEVTDEGPGVPAALAGQLFERAVSGRRGTGLGLSLARALAEADGGRLELVARQPALFAVFLSAAE